MALYDCEKEFAFAVRINEAFLKLHPPASDIEEYMLSWAMDWFDDSDVINLDAVSSLFPRRSRSGPYILKDNEVQHQAPIY